MVLKRKKFEPLKKDFEYILKNLTVNGKVPSVQELSDKFANGTATIKDGIIARLYSEGALFKVVDDKTGRFKKEFYETRFPDIADEIITFLDNFQSSQGASKAKGLGKGTTVGASGLVRSTNKIISEIKKEFADDPKYKNNYLDLPISVFEEKASDIKSPINMNAWNPTKNVIDKQFKQGKLYIRPKSSTAGTRIFRGDVDAKKVLNAILTNVAGIKNTEVKIATITALFGQRLEALIDMAKTAELAMEGGPTEYDPFYDSASKKITSPTDITGIKKEAGRKYLPPTVKTGPLLSSVLDFMSELDPDSGDIFPTLTRSQMETNLKNVVFSGIENEIALMLGRPLSGYTDLRRVFASTVINEMADQLDDETLKIKYRKAADELLGHETVDALEKGIGTVMEEHYAKVQKQKGKLVVDNVFYSFERFLAETLGAANAKGELSVKTLASRLGLNTDTLKNLDFIYSQDTNKKAIAKGESPEDKKRTTLLKEMLHKVLIFQLQLQTKKV